MTNNANIPFIQKVTWDTVGDEVAGVNLSVAKIIKKISPDNSYSLYLASYPYGCECVQKGKFYLPDNKGGMLALDNPALSADIVDDLSYNKGTHPVCLLLSNQLELFIEAGKDSPPISFGMFSPGNILSTSYILSPGLTQHPRFLWNISAGARTIFFLPKISNKRNFNRLRKTFRLVSDIPYTYNEQGPFLKELQQKAGIDWSVRVLYFGKKWFEHLGDPEWLELMNYLLRNFQSGYQFWTYKFMWDMALSFIASKLDTKLYVYLANTVKHLLFIAAGATCGLAPSTDNYAAPVDAFQDIILNVYGLKDYCPTLILPRNFDMYADSRPVYYSFQFPNFMELTHRPRKHDSVLTDVYHAFTLLIKIINELQSDDINLIGSSLYDVPNHVDFEAFHTDSDSYMLFKKASTLHEFDPALSQCAVADNKDFCDSAKFVRGCIKISCK